MDAGDAIVACWSWRWMTALTFGRNRLEPTTGMERQLFNEHAD